MSIKNNIVLVVGGSVAAVLLAGALILFVNANTDCKKHGQSLKKQEQRLSELLSRKPFPCAENVQVLENNVDVMEFHTGELSAELKQDEFSHIRVDAADFSAQAQSVIERLRRRALEADVVLPKKLEAGFARYTSGGSVPASEHVPRLMRQLYSSDRVADVLIRSKVSSIDRIARDHFENQEHSSDAAGPPRRRPRRRPAETAPIEKENKQRTADSSEYAIERIEVVFSAKEGVVWTVLEEFISAPHCMVVKELSHSTLTDILTYNPNAVVRSEDETKRFISEGILSGRTALSRPERIVAGNDIIRVSMSVDVYDFANDQKLMEVTR